MAKKALCIGINDYPGFEADLSGCVNDADDWAVYLDGRGYDVGVLANKLATKSTILHTIQALLLALKPGDTGVVQYSGHGTWLPDLDGDEPDRRDEALCPYDMDENNLILDDELAKLFFSKPAGTKLVFISDCCHSGTAHRFAGPGVTKRKIRYLPPANFVRDPEILRLLAECGMPRKVRAGRSNAPLAGVVHMAGCSDKEYSYDAVFGGRPNGAFTYYALQALAAGETTYGGLFDLVSEKLPSWEYPQTPKLNAPRALRNGIAFQ